MLRVGVYRLVRCCFSLSDFFHTAQKKTTWYYILVLQSTVRYVRPRGTFTCTTPSDAPGVFFKKSNVYFLFFIFRTSFCVSKRVSKRVSEGVVLEAVVKLHGAICSFKLQIGATERGATTRGCSGVRGSDDTRGYGVGSGDVGKELPRGWSRKSVSLWGGPARSIPRNWFIGCQSSEIP